jgi:tripartite-type tricarboxylate transporter receptor subunit TctC
LAKALHQVLQSSELRSRSLAQGVDPVGSTPEQARRIWAEAFRQAEPVVKRAHIEFP